jgi:hypothetical protein
MLLPATHHKLGRLHLGAFRLVEHARRSGVGGEGVRGFPRAYDHMRWQPQRFCLGGAEVGEEAVRLDHDAPVLHKMAVGTRVSSKREASTAVCGQTTPWIFRRRCPQG